MAVDVVTLRKASVEFGLRMNRPSVCRASRGTPERPVRGLSLKKKKGSASLKQSSTLHLRMYPPVPPSSNVITVELKHLRFQLSTVHHNWEC